jgi:protein TonB
MRTVGAMRLSVSVLCALGLHGAAFGVVAVVLSRAPVERPAPARVDLDVVDLDPPRPDPVTDSVPAFVPSKLVAAAPLRRRLRELAPARELALASNRGMIDPAAAADSPGPSSPAAPAPAAAVPSASRGPGVAAPRPGVVTSAEPRYRSNPRPDYPIPSLRRREEGIVLLDVVVQPNGIPASITLNKSCGHPLLDHAALDAVRAWTFEPARAAGVPVSSLVVVPVRFSLSDRR